MPVPPPTTQPPSNKSNWTYDEVDKETDQSNEKLEKLNKKHSKIHKPIIYKTSKIIKPIVKQVALLIILSTSVLTSPPPTHNYINVISTNTAVWGSYVYIDLNVPNYCIHDVL